MKKLFLLFSIALLSVVAKAQTCDPQPVTIYAQAWRVGHMGGVMETTQNVYVSFYSDAACTIPYVLTTGLTVTIGYTISARPFVDGWPVAGTADYPLTAGASVYDLGIFPLMTKVPDDENQSYTTYTYNYVLDYGTGYQVAL